MFSSGFNARFSWRIYGDTSSIEKRYKLADRDLNCVLRIFRAHVWRVDYCTSTISHVLRTYPRERERNPWAIFMNMLNSFFHREFINRRTTNIVLSPRDIERIIDESWIINLSWYLFITLSNSNGRSINRMQNLNFFRMDIAQNWYSKLELCKVKIRFGEKM